MKKKIAVVGAGVGGLSAALRLAHDGHTVDVFEKLDRCGGRNHLLEDRGFKFDMGPSFVLMPDFFAEVFDYCGEKIGDHLDLKAIDPSYKIFYPDGDTLTVYKDSNRTKEELERIEKDSARSFDSFISDTARLYQRVKPLLYRSFTRRDILNPAYWGLLNKINIFESYWKLAKRFFKSDKLCYAFTFEAMFMGVSPFDAPAFYSIISYADHVQKIFHPMGGMYRIPHVLEGLGRKYGAKFHYRSQVRSISKADGSIRLDIEGRQENFDCVVVNADYAYAQESLLGRRLPHYRYSCSVYLLYLGMKRKFGGLAHHNLFFSGDLNRNLKQIFKDKVIPDDPSFYLHIPTVTDPALAPAGKDLFYVLVPVPNLDKPKEDILIRQESLRNNVLGRIGKLLGVKLEDEIEVEHRFYPQDFTSRYNIKYGATFGLAHNLMQSAFFRPANTDPKMPGLYFSGASTQPGGGLPVVIASSRIVADLINGTGRG